MFSLGVVFTQFNPQSNWLASKVCEKSMTASKIVRTWLRTRLPKVNRKNIQEGCGQEYFWWSGIYRSN
eukprot:4254141-Amphidinium_carterae.2